MNIKFGKIELVDWRYQSHNEGTPNYWYGWYRSATQSFSDDAISIYDFDKNGEWSVYFGGHLSFLKNLCPQLTITAPAEEVMKQVDEFLIRMSNLAAFI